MGDDEVRTLLDCFSASIREVLPVTALWAHGSLALGDFQPGRSDFDLIAVVESQISDPAPLCQVHRRLIKTHALADKLHCTYITHADLADASLRHPTWAQGRYFDRPVSAVARRELSQGDLSLFGPPPWSLLPPTSDQELTDFIRRDLRDFWYPATAKRPYWYRDIWVDLSLVTFARASVTLQEGRLITKREALDLLPEFGAPVAMVRDISQRRYGPGNRVPLSWRIERGGLTRTFLRSGIDHVLS
jgi:hypothetical protein